MSTNLKPRIKAIPITAKPAASNPPWLFEFAAFPDL